MSADSLRKATFTGPQVVEYSPPKAAAKWNLEGVSRPYKALLPANLVISMALLYLPKDGTEWLPRLQASHKKMAESWLTGDTADVPAQVALHAFESMGYQYMQVENGEWRSRLGSVAHKHWMLFREHSEAAAQ